MRLASLFRKTMIENFRDWKIIILTLTFAPFFVVLMYFYVEETGQRPYEVLVINRDGGAAVPGMEQVLEAARDAGAYGAALSGSGPTIVAFAGSADETIAGAMKQAFKNHGIDSTVLWTSPTNQGATVSTEEGQDATS